jgi:hypothetical protein
MGDERSNDRLHRLALGVGSLAKAWIYSSSLESSSDFTPSERVPLGLILGVKTINTMGWVASLYEKTKKRKS